MPCLTRIFALTYHKTYEVIIWHDDVIKWRHIPRCWPFTRGIHRSPVNSPHRGQWRGILMFSLISTRVNGWAIVRLVISDAIMLIMTSLVKNGWLLQMTFSKVYYLRKLFLTDNFDLCCCCVGANNNMPSLLRLVSWRRTGDMPLPELMMLLPHFEGLVLK